ncbi:CAMK family protein kinase [Trichomonas vaginalis G3]|uniref:CAMK family protein kinase n=1 Tax=Trichomonas vaginalis (strain ATCC PRA-98 / G3) TaxID=412133 RepID=A2FKP9_TRIV3|nr:peptidyl-threonine phosphorylation [Trichomonas vaginalis G3]EAX94511.1 CAMK family protein kinase [Trichomonas vaginalis G3]KAI5501093.1 peptidyl-threonine phosphorylation [Trichomonas vaginalis G3]|eukprot:XP_001307441.1 CAMK family protein kinase [Trichomonas vaginalis G3]
MGVNGSEHPLLAVVSNPINRFCDEFASSLCEDINTKNTKQSQSYFQSADEEIEGYSIIRRIGDGAEAAVYEAIKNDEGISVALKRYKKVNNLRDGIPLEVEIAKMLDNDYCLKVFSHFKSVTGDFIVTMPLAQHGALQPSNKPEISISGAIQLVYQIGNGLQYMHSHRIVHRDIKPQNILLLDGNYVLCDYSVSAVLKSDDELLTGYTGSPIFMAPEVSPTLYKPRPPDLWSLGVTVYVLLFGCYPYKLERGLVQVEQNYVKNVSKSLDLGDLTFPEVPSIPQELKDVIAGLLEKNPDQRMTASDICNNPWLVSEYEESQNLYNSLAS